MSVVRPRDHEWSATFWSLISEPQNGSYPNGVSRATGAVAGVRSRSAPAVPSGAGERMYVKVREVSRLSRTLDGVVEACSGQRGDRETMPPWQGRPSHIQTPRFG